MAFKKNNLIEAGVVKLADTLDSGSSEITLIGVRVHSQAPSFHRVFQ